MLVATAPEIVVISVVLFATTPESDDISAVLVTISAVFDAMSPESVEISAVFAAILLVFVATVHERELISSVFPATTPESVEIDVLILAIVPERAFWARISVKYRFTIPSVDFLN